MRGDAVRRNARNPAQIAPRLLSDSDGLEFHVSVSQFRLRKKQIHFSKTIQRNPLDFLASFTYILHQEKPLCMLLANIAVMRKVNVSASALAAFRAPDGDTSTFQPELADIG